MGVEIGEGEKKRSKKNLHRQRKENLSLSPICKQSFEYIFSCNQIQSMPHLFSNLAGITFVIVIHIFKIFAQDHKMFFCNTWKQPAPWALEPFNVLGRMVSVAVLLKDRNTELQEPRHRRRSKKVGHPGGHLASNKAELDPK